MIYFLSVLFIFIILLFVFSILGYTLGMTYDFSCILTIAIVIFVLTFLVLIFT